MEGGKHVVQAVEAPPARWTGVLFILGSAFCFSTMGTIVKDAYNYGATPTGILALRMLVGSAIWIVVFNRRLGSIEWRSPHVRRLALGGTLGIALASLTEYAAYQHLPVAFVVVVLFMAPAWVAIGQWVLTGRGVGGGGIAGLAFLAVGLALLTELGFAGISFVGVGLALAASLGIAAFFTLAGDSIDEVGPPRSAAVVALSSLAIVVPAAVIDGTLVDSLTSSAVLYRGALLGFVATVVSLVLLLNGLRRLGAFPASVVSAIEPVFAGLLAWWVLGEVLTVSQVAGAGLVIIGSLVVEWGRPRVEETAPAPVR